MRTENWNWPPTETFAVKLEGTRVVGVRNLVAEYDASEDAADQKDYRLFLVVIWIGAICYCALFGLGVWKAAQLIGGLL